MKAATSRSHHHEYRGLLVIQTLGSLVFMNPADPARVIATARLRPRVGWSLRIPGHIFPLPDNHPLRLIPGDPIPGFLFKAFPTWQACAREVIRVFQIALARHYEGFRDDIRPGDVLTYWHDTGAFGAQLAYCRVVKLGKVKIRVSAETSHHESWQYPHLFHEKLAPETVAELRAEGIDI
jgi:hypothetical protein